MREFTSGQGLLILLIHMWTLLNLDERPTSPVHVIPGFAIFMWGDYSHKQPRMLTSIWYSKWLLYCDDPACYAVVYIVAVHPRHLPSMVSWEIVVETITLNVSGWPATSQPPGWKTPPYTTIGHPKGLATQERIQILCVSELFKDQPLCKILWSSAALSGYSPLSLMNNWSLLSDLPVSKIDHVLLLALLCWQNVSRLVSLSFIFSLCFASGCSFYVQLCFKTLFSVLPEWFLWTDKYTIS